MAPSSSPAVETIKSGSSADYKPAPLAGKLFFNDRERSQMDQLRDRPKDAAQQAENLDVRSIINGYVRRGDGVAYVWIDGDYKQLNDVRLASRVRANSVGMDVGVIKDSGDMAKLPVSAPIPGESKAHKPKQKARAKSKPPAKLK